MLGKLTFVNRDGRQRVHPIVQDRVYVVGRGDRVDIRVPDNSVSRSHCVLEKAGEAFKVSDLTSSNGTLLNGERIDGSAGLKDGDEIQIGETRFRFQLVPDAERFALLTEVPDENEFDPMRPGHRFAAWDNPDEPPRDSVIPPPTDPSLETRMLEAPPELRKKLADAAARGESSEDEEALDLEAATAEVPAPGLEVELEGGEEEGEADLGDLAESEGGEGAGEDSGQEETEGGEPSAETSEEGGGELDLAEVPAPAEEAPEPEVAEEPPPPPKKKKRRRRDEMDEDMDVEGAPPVDPEEEAFAQRCVEMGLLDEDKMSLARMQRDLSEPGKPIGMYLVDRKLITYAQLKKLQGGAEAEEDEGEDEGKGKAPAKAPEKVPAKVQAKVPEKPTAKAPARPPAPKPGAAPAPAPAAADQGDVEDAEERRTKRDNVLFGKLAVRKEFITPEQLDECLGEQQAAKQKRSIGQILIDKGYMTKHQVDSVLKAQQREVLRCTDCDAAYMVGNLEPGRRLKCKSCGAILTVPPAPVEKKKLDSLSLPDDA